MQKGGGIEKEPNTKSVCLFSCNFIKKVNKNKVAELGGDMHHLLLVKMQVVRQVVGRGTMYNYPENARFVEISRIIFMKHKIELGFSFLC